MRVDGSHPSGHRFAFRLGGEAGPHRLTIASDDLGAALQLFDVADNVIGGKLSLTAQLADEAGKPVLRAQIDRVGLQRRAHPGLYPHPVGRRRSPRCPA